jgi:hypothetical protein
LWCHERRDDFAHSLTLRVGSLRSFIQLARD